MKQVNKIEIEVLRGDITKLSVDGLIVPQACDHVFENRINKRLYYCGGDSGLCAYGDFAKRLSLKSGSVVVTESDGNAVNLLYAAVSAGDDVFSIVKNCIYQALVRAEEMKLSVLAIPDFLGDGDKELLSPSLLVQAVLSALKIFPNDKGIIKELSVISDCGFIEYEKAAEILENHSEPL